MTSLKWPPGLLCLAQLAPTLAFPPLLVLLVHQYGTLKLPGYMWIIAYLLSTPAVHFINGILHHFREENEIKKLGARRVPRVPSYWPGGLDILITSVKSFAEGYPGMLQISFLTVICDGMDASGDVWAHWCVNVGFTMNLRIFWDDLVRRSKICLRILALNIN